MKKIGTLLALGTVAGAGICAANNYLHKALISRNFEVPEAVSKFISETGESDFDSVAQANMQWMLDYGFELHHIVNDRGHKLQGYLMRPEKPSDVYVFGSHGYRSDGKGEWCHYAKHYVEELGFNLFFVDHQAAGESEGEYIGFASHESKDSLKWLRYMVRAFGDDIQIILHGISMGSATVMLMSGSDELVSNVKFTIADCGYTSALDEFNYKIETLKLPLKCLIPVVNSMNRKKAGYDFHKDTNALGAVARAKVPMLFIHGGDDKFVPTYMVYLLHDACTAEYKDLLIVPGADHAQSYYTDKKAYEGKMDEFISKFISSKKEKYSVNT
ncbi:MAG: alpha/beta hydrolase [Clostridia bacterium]|nr:alpha/beta hydrolase [Clostridia bacterium]